METFCRTLQLLGHENFTRLQRARIAVFGLGAVGSFALEALARAGIGYFLLVDHDVVSASNINRQLLALHSTLGQSKAELAKRRVLDINPECHVDARMEFVQTDTVHTFLGSHLTGIVDAIDGVNSKVNLIVAAREAGLPVVSSMGAAAKLDPTRVQSADISQTFMCPLAQIVRKRLRRRGVTAGVRCIFSSEAPQNKNAPLLGETAEQGISGRPREPLGSISYMTGLFGLLAAREIIASILQAE